MSDRIPGIHHVTAVAGDPQGNIDFYTGALGLRLVKRTVNFDDPGTYHFYFGDKTGAPGTLLTFFPWPGIPRGTPGSGEVSAVAYAVPPGALAFWAERLGQRGVSSVHEPDRFGAPVLAFPDPDGTRLELVEEPRVARVPAWTGGGIGREHAIRGFHGATLQVRTRDRTEALLTDVMGFEPRGEASGRRRFRAASEGHGSIVDVIETPDAPRAALGAGSVHHIAWRASDDAAQARWKQRLDRRGLHVTPVQQRQYFRSIYFREAGGVLFEIATDGPGFATDETVEHLGSELKLPPWLEPMHERIERALPPIRTAEPQRST